MPPVPGASGSLRIFLLENDQETRNDLVKALSQLGHVVSVASEGRAALRCLVVDRFDVIILDRIVPGIDGLTVLQLARQGGVTTPAIMLTAMARIEDRVAGLLGGADDYMVKPFAFAELSARLVALARRSARDEAVESAMVLRAGDVEMDLVRRTVIRSGRAVHLQPREFSLLEQLLRNAGSVVTRKMLLERVWNFGFDPKTNIIETHMSRLRTKLNEYASSNPIHTIRGTGYVLHPEGASTPDMSL